MPELRNWEPIFGGVSLAISLVGYSLYARSILRGKTRPHIFTWLIWGIGTVVVFAAQLSKHEGAGSWATASGFGACVVMSLLALRYGEKDITFSDKICFALALLALPLWWLTHDPLAAVIIIIVTDAFAYYPTFRKSFHKPFEENATMYALDMVKYSLSLLAMSHAALASVLYPWFVIITNGMFLTLVFLRRRKTLAVLGSMV